MHPDMCACTMQEDVLRYVLPSIAARLGALGALAGLAAGALKRSLVDLVAFRRAPPRRPLLGRLGRVG